MIDKKNKILNLKIENKNILELGCGLTRKFANSITIDVIDLETVDVIANINEGLSFIPDSSIDEIHSSHFLEHVQNLELVMSEIYRILKPGGRKIGTVPHFSNPHFYSDYTHKSFFGLYTFFYFSKHNFLRRKVPMFYNGINFRIIEIKFNFASHFKINNYFSRIYQRVFNLNYFMKEYYEENLCYLFPAIEISFVLEKIDA